MPSSPERPARSIDARILDAVPDVVLVVTGDGQIAYANQQTIRVLGFPPEELVGRPHDLLVPVRFRDAHREHVRRYLKTPVTRPMGIGLTLAALCKDGREIPIEVSLGAQGAGEGIVVTLRDATERVRLQLEKDLLASHLEEAFSLLPDMVAIFDPSDRLVKCNSVFRERFRSVPDPFLGRTFLELFEAILDQTGVRSASQREQMAAKRLCMHRERDGRPRTIEAPDGKAFRVVERRTADGGTLVLGTDITEDERAAKELREARHAAEAASRAKSEFLSSMSHELRTPLNAIVGFAELLRRDKRDPLSALGKERADQILRAGTHLANLVDDILDLSRIEAGRVSVSVEPTNVLEVLRTVREAIDSTADAKGIHIVEEPLSDDTLSVLADRTRLVQIVTNFGSNAIKYNEPGGQVVLGATVTSSGGVRISVIDTGIGIPSEKQHLLFQPFQRAGQETGPIEGTGIGLVIAKQLAEMMGGRVGFESRPREGSHFWVELPASARRIVRPTPLPEPPPVPAALGEGNRVVLYIEDNPANVSFMRSLFASFRNATLHVSKTAEEGLALAKEHRPDVVVMDLFLPGMDGLEALRLLRGQRELASVPVIALTAATSQERVHHEVPEGFAAYLTKPVQFDSLLSTLEDVLRGTPATPTR